jgi:hypothetical protein
MHLIFFIALTLSRNHFPFIGSHVLCLTTTPEYKLRIYLLPAIFLPLFP